MPTSDVPIGKRAPRTPRSRQTARLKLPRWEQGHQALKSAQCKVEFEGQRDTKRRRRAAAARSAKHI